MKPPASVLARVLAQLRLPVFVFEGVRQIYANAAAEELADRLRAHDRIELRVLLLDHIAGMQDDATAAPTVTLLTSHSGEPFYLHVLPIPRQRRRQRPTYAVTVRSSGADVHAFRRRYRLSAREGQITELVLRGADNREIAQALGISIATAKKHIGKIFDKVGVDSRGQLMARLG